LEIDSGTILIFAVDAMISNALPVGGTRSSLKPGYRNARGRWQIALPPHWFYALISSCQKQLQYYRSSGSLV
jgi:hypothetical protein